MMCLQPWIDLPGKSLPAMKCNGILLLFCSLLVSCQRPETPGSTVKLSGMDSTFTLLDSLTDAIAADSLNASLFNRRAVLFLSQKQINQALSDINLAMGLDPQNPEYFMTLSDIYLEMGSVEKARDALNKASDLAPMDPVPWFKTGYIHLIVRDYTAAREYFRKALELDYVYPEASFHLGLSFLETGDTMRAIQYIQTAAQQDQQYVEAYVLLASLYAPILPEVAAGYYRGALRIDTGNTQLRYNLGMLLQEMGNNTEAEQQYRHILRIDSSFFLASYNLGYIYLIARENYGEAVRFFDLSLRMNPTYVDALYNRGLCYEILGQYDRARNDYQQALHVMPNYPRAVEGMNRLDTLLTQE